MSTSQVLYRISQIHCHPIGAQNWKFGNQISNAARLDQSVKFRDLLLIYGDPYSKVPLLEPNRFYDASIKGRLPPT